MRYIFFLLIIFCISCGTLKEGKKELADKNSLAFPMETILNSISKSMAQNPSLTKYRRIAVMPLFPFGKSQKAKERFGEFFADSFTSFLKKTDNHIKLYERGKLEMLLKEHELSLIGIVNPEEAKKLGEFVPIDAIFTGSYTKLKDYVEVNCRLIDVVSGEILTTFNRRILIDENLEALFAKDNRSQTPKEITVLKIKKEDSEKEVCLKKHLPVLKALNDLSTEQKIEKVVTEALQFPLFKSCGDIHYTVIKTFIKHDVNHSGYKEFLLKSLSELSSVPDRNIMYGTLRVMNYFVTDSVMTEKEWAVALSVMKKLTLHHYFYYYFEYLLIPDNVEIKDYAQAKKRMDYIITQIKNGGVGLPVPAKIDAVILQLFDTLEKDPKLMIYAYNTYGKDVPQDKYLRLFSYVKDCYTKAKTIDEKELVLQTVIAYFNTLPVTDKSARKLVEFARLSGRYMPEEHHALLMEKCGKLYSKMLQALTSYRNETRIRFCLKHHISCPTIVPTIDELKKTLILSDKSDEQARAAEFLFMMGDDAKSAEKTVVKVLKYISQGRIKGGKTAKTRDYCIKILGHIKPTHKEALSTLASFLTSSEKEAVKQAKNALISNGKPAAPYVADILLNEKNTTDKEEAVKVLYNMGKNAISAKRKLQKFIQLSTDDFLKDKVSALLQNM